VVSPEQILAAQTRRAAKTAAQDTLGTVALDTLGAVQADALAVEADSLAIS